MITETKWTHDCMKIDINLYRFFQTQISTNDWPSDGYWPKLLEAYKFTYYNWTFDYDEYINYVMNENNTDTSQQGVDLMRSYVKNNYVKVSKLIKEFTVLKISQIISNL